MRDLSRRGRSGYRGKSGRYGRNAGGRRRRRLVRHPDPQPRFGAGGMDRPSGEAIPPDAQAGANPVPDDKRPIDRGNREPDGDFSRNGAHAHPRPLCQVERRDARRAVREGAPLLPLTHHRRYRAAAMGSDGKQPLVPLAGLEPALLAELDFESSASTNFTTGAPERSLPYGEAPGLAQLFLELSRPRDRTSVAVGKGESVHEEL